MKKLLLLAIIIVILLAAGGVGYYLYSQKHAGNLMASSPVLNSIQDALSKSLSLQCTFTDDQKRQITAYIKAGAVRADTVGNDPSQQYNSSSVIIKDKKMYIWDTTKKQGMIMELNQHEATAPTGSAVQGNSNGSSGQSAGDVMGMLNKYKQYCKPAVVSDSLFTTPSDVTFQDLSKMMPTVAIPSGMTQQDAQKMMQQYQQQIPQGQ